VATSDRRREILEALADQLERHPGERVTTARLASVVGVSEAALYRHFPSKAKMFESLIEFAEESVFSLLNRIITEESSPARRCERIVGMLLAFADKNPGITRVLLGDALIGEHERLRSRAAQFFDRFETQLRQVLRDARQHDPSLMPPASVSGLANLLMAVAEGRMAQFSRSGFTRSPLDGWNEQWRELERVVFNRSPASRFEFP
jgi:TetR/AcrR family transcriptional regulator